MSAKKASALLKFLVVLVVLATAGGAAVFFLRPMAKVQAVTRGNAASVVPGSVVVDAERVSSIASEVEGKLVENILAPGKVVKEGEIIARLDTTDIDLEIAQAKSEYEAAKKSAEIALEVNKLNWKTQEEGLADAERDYKAGRSADLSIEQRRRSQEVARHSREKQEADDAHRVASLENTLEVSKRKKEKMMLHAPFDGTISEVFFKKNDLVGSKQAIATIIALARLVRAQISEENFAAVAVGAKAKINFLGYPGRTFHATVTQKLPTAETATQRYVAYLQIDDIKPEELLPNLTGEVGITAGEHNNVLLVPRRAMWNSYVYAIEDGRARERRLDLGFVDFNFIEVKSGLKEGDLVIVDDLDKFHDGQRVRPLPALKP